MIRLVPNCFSSYSSQVKTKMGLPSESSLAGNFIAAVALTRMEFFFLFLH